MSNNSNLKVSIVCAYHNRHKLMFKTLESIMMSKHKNIEIIIINDASSDIEQLKEGLKKFTQLVVKLINIPKEEKGDRHNPSIPFNIGFKHATGDIVIIQNPESYHIGDVIQYIINNIKYNQYLVFSAYNVSLEQSNEKFYQLKEKTLTNIVNESIIPRQGGHLKWFHHKQHRPTYYHFCSAIYRENLNILGGFDETYRKGCCYDDDDLVFKVREVGKYNIISIPPENNPFIVNLYHPPSISTNALTGSNTFIKSKILENENYFKNKVNSINKGFKYPRILHMYWNGKLSFLNYITVLSFIKYHPAWVINIYITRKSNEKNVWSSNEQKKIDFVDYFPKLKDLENVNIIDYTDKIVELGLESLNYIYQSDILRNYFMFHYGGVWGDFDIIYIKNIESVLCKYKKDIIFRCQTKPFPIYYYPVGFYLSNRGSKFFKTVYDLQMAKLKENYKNGYQVFGSHFLNKLLGCEKEHNERHINQKKNEYQVEMLGNNVYLPIGWSKVHFLYKKMIPRLITNEHYEFDNDTVGVHFFNGGPSTKEYIQTFNKKTFTVKCTIDKLISEYIKDL